LGAAVRLTMLRPRVETVDLRIAAPPAKVAASIYGTAEHAEWRRIVIKRAEGRCQALTCQAPGRRASRLFADHIVELRDGGDPFDPANGQALCGACHTRKTAAARAARQRGDRPAMPAGRGWPKG
jgi:5-methylcytosine-specific restriction protein A